MSIRSCYIFSLLSLIVLSAHDQSTGHYVSWEGNSHTRLANSCKTQVISIALVETLFIIKTTMCKILWSLFCVQKLGPILRLIYVLSAQPYCYNDDSEMSHIIGLRIVRLSPIPQSSLPVTLVLKTESGRSGWFAPAGKKFERSRPYGKYEFEKDFN